MNEGRELRPDGLGKALLTLAFATLDLSVAAQTTPTATST